MLSPGRARGTETSVSCCRLGNGANWIKEGAGGATEEAHETRFLSSVDGSRWCFFTCLCTIQLVFLASQFVVDQQPICWAGQPTESSTRFFIKPPKQHSTMLVLRPKTLRQGLSGGGGKTKQKDLKELMRRCYPNKAGAILLGKKVCHWHPHVTYPTVGILTSSHTNTTEKVNIHIKLRFTGHVHIHSQHSQSTTQKIHIYTSSTCLCIQMIDRSHDNIHA